MDHERLAVAIERCTVNLEHLITKLDQHIEDDEKLSSRVTELEKLRWRLGGVWIVLGAGLAWLFKHF